MRYSYQIIASTGLLALVSGHGLVTSIQGANGVTMPGLSGTTISPKTPSVSMEQSEVVSASKRANLLLEDTILLSPLFQLFDPLSFLPTSIYCEEEG